MLAFTPGETRKVNVLDLAAQQSKVQNAVAAKTCTMSRRPATSHTIITANDARQIEASRQSFQWGKEFLSARVCKCSITNGKQNIHEVVENILSIEHCDVHVARMRFYENQLMMSQWSRTFQDAFGQEYFLELAGADDGDGVSSTVNQIVFD